MTKYIFKDDSWWDDPGCECCEPCLMACYNCTSHEINFSIHSFSEIYAVAIYHFLEYDLDDYDFLETTPYYSMDQKELKAECGKLGIKVKIK